MAKKESHTRDKQQETTNAIDMDMDAPLLCNFETRQILRAPFHKEIAKNVCYDVEALFSWST
jgi:hypothetical protein